MSSASPKPSPVALEIAFLAIRRAGGNFADELLEAFRDAERQAVDILLNAPGEELQAAQGYAAALRIMADRLANAEKNIANFNVRAGENKARSAHP